MKIFFSVFACFVWVGVAFGQAPEIVWKQTLGGTEADQATSIDTTSDGGFIIAGSTSSSNGDIQNGNHGGTDGWVIKFSKGNVKEWEFTYGGSGGDNINSIHQTMDGGYIFAGSTTSNLPRYHGSTDMWVGKLSSAGTILWQATYGGSGIEIANSIRQAKDGGFFVAGFTTSNDGDVSGHRSGFDFWILKLNVVGNILWQKDYGSYYDDIANDIVESPDGGCVVAGYCGYSGGDVPSTKGGGLDMWVLGLDANGAKIPGRNYTYGGSSDDFARCIQRTNDGGYIVAGGSNSSDGQVSGYRSSTDFWVVKLDYDLTKTWAKPWGLITYDAANAVMATDDGGCIVAGQGNNLSQFYVFKLGKNGVFEWERQTGGSQSDVAYAICPGRDNRIIVTGQTFSSDGDVVANHGGGDVWVEKLGAFNFIDPFTSNMVDNNGKIKTNLSSANLDYSITGASTDGVTKVLITSDINAPLTFSVASAKEGDFSSLTNQNEHLQSLTSTLDPVSGKYGIIYTVPDGYGANNERGGYSITIKAMASGGFPWYNKKLRLVTPPVVMMHGMWSSPDVWNKGNFKPYLIQRGISNVELVDYQKYNYMTFDPYNPESLHAQDAMINSVSNALKSYRNQKIVAAQVDVVGHSLGALHSRNFIQSYKKYRDIENFFNGSIHKLITLGAPHLGSNWGRILYNGNNLAAVVSYVNGPVTYAEYLSVSYILETFGFKVGSCHKDFNPAFKGTNEGLDNLGVTKDLKVHVIASRWDDPNQPKSRTGTEELLKILSKGIKLTIGVLLGDNENDAVVPRYSQQGGISNPDYYDFYINTSHSPSPLFADYTQTNNVDIQQEVANLLISDNTTDFAPQLDAPKNISTPFDKMKSIVMSVHTKSPASYAAFKITSPFRNTTLSNNGEDTLHLAYYFSDTGQLSDVVFLIRELGLVTLPATSPFSTSVVIPKSLASSKLSIAALANDTNGVIYADTLSVVLNSRDSLLSLSSETPAVQLDTTHRETGLNITGTYFSASGNYTRNLNNAEAGTMYFTKNGNSSVISVASDGFVIAKHFGTDTITALNGGKSVIIPVRVDSNFAFVTRYSNSINFDSIPYKTTKAASFALSAQSSSGEQVAFQLVGGSAKVNNQIVTVNGAGIVTIKATSGGNAYFDSAAPVTRTFNVLPATYTFVGKGNWNVDSNWIDNSIPPSTLFEGQEIIINPSGNNECILNVQQTISDNSSMRVLHGKRLTILNNLNIEKLAKCNVE